MNDKARQHILAIFIIILLVLCVFSSFYGFPVKHAKADTIPPTITINFAGNLSDSGGPYWRPPGESDILDEAGEGIWRDGYYTNDSRQSEGWMYINLTVEDDDGVPNVWLQWKNDTTWTNWTYAFLNTTGGYFEFNTSGNLSTGEGYDYSFNIVANDTGSNSNWVGWNKTGIGGSYTRRHVQLNCTSSNITYTPLYCYDAEYTTDDTYEKDRLHHDQGADGTVNDAGYLNRTIPGSIVNNRHCNAYIGYWFNEDICIEPFTLKNVYFHLWVSCQPTKELEIGVNKTRDRLSYIGKIEYYVTDLSDSHSNFSYDGGTTYDQYYLQSSLLPFTDTTFTDNDIYEFSIVLNKHILAETPRPSVISNRSFTSFVLFNIPDNATLNASHADTDSDSLSDWNELYTTYTNPFLADTDNDSVTDYHESLSGSDPNNYTDTIPYNITGIHSMPRVNPSGVTDIFNTSANATMTITNGYNCSYGVWYGTTFPVNEENMVGNISNTEIEYSQDNSTLNAYITGLTPSQLYYTTAWVSNPSGFYNSSYYNYSFNNYSYVVNGSGWHYITFPGSIWDNNQQVADAEDDDERIVIETFLEIGGILDDVDWIFRVSDAKNWNKGAGGNTLTNLTYNEEYYIHFLNATNISFVFDLDTGTYYYPNMTFPQEIFNYNSSINANNTCENFCQQGGIWDDIDWIFEIPSYKNWNKGAGGNTLTTIDYEYEYWFYMLNYTANLNFTYDNATINSTFLTRPNPPTNLTCRFTVTYANLTWNRNTSANKTVVTVKIDSYPTSPTDGTEIYNGTAESYNDTYANYASRFYKAWSFTNWSYNPTLYQFSSGNTSNSTTDVIDPPSDGQSSYYYPYLNLSWTRDDKSIQEVVVSRNDTWAISVNQTGNWIRQNSTNTYFNASEIEMRYYTIWSYNNTKNIYSVLGLNIPWGALAINVYNESNGSQGIIFNIEISNSDSTDVYYAYNLSNTLYLDMNDIPYGDNTIFFITADGYLERTSYYNLTLNTFYDYNFWLPPYTTPTDPGGGDPGENYTTTRLYRLRVIDDYAYPVADATVQIRRYMNATGQYENMSVLQTDGYGEADLYLIPGEHYRAFVSKDGFDSGIFDWIPDPVFYGANYPKIFQIVRSTEIITTYTFYDLIRFNATLHTNGSMFVNYIDYDTNTTDAQFYIYENYNSSRTFIETVSTTSNTYSFWVDNVNYSREHEIIIYLNHTTLGFEIESIIISPVSDAEYDGGGEIERKIEAVFGPFSLGYVQVFLVYLPIMVFLVLPGPKHPGFAIIMASLYAGFASSFIIVGSILMIVPFAIAIGAVLMAVKGGMFKL